MMTPGWIQNLTLCSYCFAAAEFGQWNNTSVWAEQQVEQVKRTTGPQVNTGEPHQYSVLETLGQVRSGGVPGQVPVLKSHSTYHSHMKLIHRAPSDQSELNPTSLSLNCLLDCLNVASNQKSVLSCCVSLQPTPPAAAGRARAIGLQLLNYCPSPVWSITH